MQIVIDILTLIERDPQCRTCLKDCEECEKCSKVSNWVKEWKGKQNADSN